MRPTGAGPNNPSAIFVWTSACAAASCAPCSCRRSGERSISSRSRDGCSIPVCRSASRSSCTSSSGAPSGRAFDADPGSVALSADPRFGVLREALAAYASDPDDPAPGAAEILQAAVALVVRAGEQLDVLLIKRAKRDGDPWSGHMALPGGRRDASDESLLDTAVRETEEETGVELQSRVVHLGRLEEVRPQS